MLGVKKTLNFIKKIVYNPQEAVLVLPPEKEWAKEKNLNKIFASRRRCFNKDINLNFFQQHNND